MGEIKEKIFIGLLVAALVPAVIFFVSLFGSFPVEKPEAVVQAETTLPTEADPPTEAETVPETTEPPQTVPEETVPETTEPAVTFDVVPEYFQGDYAHIRYGQSNMAYGGSGVVSLSMVASFLTGHEYLPDQMMEFFDHLIGSSMDWLEDASDALQLPWKRAANVHEVLNAVREGKIAIALMGSASRFSSGYHYIVLTGVNDEGRFMVNDPDVTNYTKWGLEEGFVNGFEDKELTVGFSGGWIYDPEAMPEEPFIYREPEPVECRYPGVELTEWETYLLAQLIYMEAQGECYEGQQAVAEVVLNRLVSEDFPNNIHDIIYAGNQFPSAENLDLAKPTHVQYEAIERALYGPYILPIDVVFYATFRVNDNVWGDIGNHTFCYGY